VGGGGRVEEGVQRNKGLVTHVREGRDKGGRERKKNEGGREGGGNRAVEEGVQ